MSHSLIIRLAAAAAWDSSKPDTKFSELPPLSQHFLCMRQKAAFRAVAANVSDGMAVSALEALGENNVKAAIAAALMRIAQE